LVSGQNLLFQFQKRIQHSAKWIRLYHHMKGRGGTYLFESNKELVSVPGQSTSFDLCNCLFISVFWFIYISVCVCVCLCVYI